MKSIEKNGYKNVQNRIQQSNKTNKEHKTQGKKWAKLCNKTEIADGQTGKH